MFCKLILKKGSSGLWPNNWGIWRHLIPWHKVFHWIASLHDYKYTQGGSWYNKLMADLALFNWLDKLAKTKFQKFLARFYKNLVAKYGYKYFNYEK